MGGRISGDVATPTLGPARPMQVIATAGHVDHGKSALLRALTSMEPDRWVEEQRRGLTIDLGFVWTDVVDASGEPHTIAFVDVPGHDSFLPNMLCGVGVVEQVLFVVAADDGWSEQSQEHLEILDLLGRRCVAAVVTKRDLVAPERTAAVMQDLRRRLAGSSLDDAPVLSVAALRHGEHDSDDDEGDDDGRNDPDGDDDGSGIAQLRTTIVDRLQSRSDPAAPAPARSAAEPPRLWIDRVFSIRGAGTVVTGMLATGRLHVGEEIDVAPRGLSGRIRGLQSLGRPVTSADAPMRVAVNLSGLSQDQVARGDVLLQTTNPAVPRTATAIDATLRALPHTSIGRRGAWHLHVGTAVTGVRVLPLLDELEPGTQGPVRLELDDPLPVRAGDRFVVRDAGRHRTAGGGIVLDPAPGPRRRGTDRRLHHAMVLEELARATQSREQMLALVDAHDGRRSRAQLVEFAGIDPVGEDDLVVLGDTVVRSATLTPWVTAVCAAAAEAPGDQAIDTSHLVATATRSGCPADLAPSVVEHLVRQGSLRRLGGRLVHPDNEVTYRRAREARRTTFLDRLAERPWEPPDPSTTVEEVGIPSHEVQALIDEGDVVACGPVLFLPSAIQSAMQRLREGPGRDGAAFTASQARQWLDTNRRCIMPLLDHLRSTGVTTFDGEHHRMEP